MAKSGRTRAPRDRKRPYRFPKPPCSPRFPGPPEPVSPGGSECGTGPDPRKLFETLKRGRKRGPSR